MADQRPSVYREDGYWVIRASAFGKCPLALARIAVGMEGEPVPAGILDAMEFGTKNEQVVIDGLPERGWKPVAGARLGEWGPVDDTGQLALELVVGKVKVRCHPDGIVEAEQMRTTGDDVRVLEVKCMAEGNDPQKGVYDWQFGIEMAVTGLPMLLAIGWKQVDEDGTRSLGDIELREVDIAPKSVAEIKVRAMKLAKMFDAAVEGRWEDIEGSCDESMYPCPFYQMHNGDKGEWQEIVDEAKVREIDELGRRILAGTAEVKALDERVKGDKKRLRELVGDGFKGLAGGWKIAVTVSHVEESTRVVKAHERTTVKIEQREKD